jgi:hypothetical protein
VDSRPAAKCPWSPIHEIVLANLTHPQTTVHEGPKRPRIRGTNAAHSRILLLGTSVAEGSVVRSIPLVAASILALALLAPSEARAGGAVLGEPRATGPVAIRVATSSDGTLTTRWQSVVVPAGERIAWLVPARPGARIDFAGEPFFAALDESTTVHVARPRGGTAACGPEGSLEAISDVPPNERTQREPAGPSLLADEAELRRFAQEQGFTVPSGFGARAFRNGFSWLAIPFASSARATTTPVVRVTDDGPPSLPLVLASAVSNDVEITAFVVSEGSAQIGSNATFADGALTWSAWGSNYRSARTSTLLGYRGFGFLTEASGHDLVFGPRGMLPNGTFAPTLVSAYASRIARTPAESAACASTLLRMTNHPVRFGAVCPEGSVARLPPENECVPKAGDADISLAACGGTELDLALALSGKRIDRIAVTRAAGLLPAGSLGSFVGFAEGQHKEPLVTAKLDDLCLPAVPFAQPPGPSQSPPPRRGGTGVASSEDPEATGTSYSSGGCSGGTVYASDTDTSDTSDTSSDSCSSSDTTDSGASDDSGCGGDTVGGDNDGSSDACSSDSSSSDSSDSCSSGSGDSCDSPDASLRKGKRGKSPMSRAAFLIVALALPMRRLFRKRDPSDVG